jgi:hypothetical protein
MRHFSHTAHTLAHTKHIQLAKVQDVDVNDNGNVLTLAFSPRGDRFVAGSNDGACKMFSYPGRICPASSWTHAISRAARGRRTSMRHKPPLILKAPSVSLSLSLFLSTACEFTGLVANLTGAIHHVVFSPSG